MRVRNIISLLVLGTVLSACSIGNKNIDNVATDSNASINKEAYIKDIQDSIDYSYANSVYSIVRLDKDLDMSVIYDTSGKAYAETDYSNGFYIDKNKSILSKYDVSKKPYYNLEVEYTPLYSIEKALELVKDNKADLTQSVFEDNSSKGSKDYLITIKGSNIKSFYSDLDSDSLDKYMLSYYNHTASELTNFDSLNIALSVRDTNLIDAIMFIGDKESKNIWVQSCLFTLGGITFDDTIKDIKSTDSFDSISDKLNKEKEIIGEKLSEAVTNNKEIKDMLENRIKSVE